MKTVKEIRKEISEGLTDICVYSDIEKMKTYVLIAIADGIKNSIKENPYCYDYNQNYLFKMSERVNENDIFDVIVDSLASSGYTDNGCKCEYDEEKDEYRIKIRLLLYSFTQEEKKKLKIADNALYTLPRSMTLAMIIVLTLFLLYLWGSLLEVTLLSPLAVKISAVICMSLPFLSLFYICITDSIANKIIKSKW